MKALKKQLPSPRVPACIIKQQLQYFVVLCQSLVDLIRLEKESLIGVSLFYASHERGRERGRERAPS